MSPTLLVWMAGASFLAIEILAARMLGPYRGQGPFLHATLTSVALLAAAAGLAWAGRRADRADRPGSPAVPLGVAGLWVLAAPWMRRPLLQLLERLGSEAATVIGTIVLFGVPWALVATAIPYGFRGLGGAGQRPGTALARVLGGFALAALAGALLARFVLVPGIGVTRSAAVVGLWLVAAGLLAFRFPPGALAALAAVLAAALLPAGKGVPRADAVRGVLWAGSGAAGEVRVLAKDGARYLVVDGSIQQVVAPETWRSLHRGHATLMVAKRLFTAPGDLLLLGLRGGSVARSFARDGWAVRAVEEDALAASAAPRLGLDPAAVRLEIAEPRAFVRRDDRIHDLIVLDTFGSSFVPPYLATREFFAELEPLLAPGGVLAVVVESVGWEDPLIRALAATLRTRFTAVTVLPASEPPDALGSQVLLASHRPLELRAALPHPYPLLADPDEHWEAVQMSHGWDNRHLPDPRGVRPLTDDWSPADLWGERINGAARRELHGFFGTSVASW